MIYIYRCVSFEKDNMRKLPRVSAVSRADMKVGDSKACFVHIEVIIGENVCVLSPYQ